MEKSPKVSVIIPTYNRADFIQKSIKSVLGQTYKNLELIIVDDSNDDTEAKVKEIKDDRLIYIKNPKRMGVSVARNIGIKIAGGELIAFQDSDDEWHLDKLEKQVDLLVNSSVDVAAVYCGMEFFDVQTGEKTGEDLSEFDFRKSFTEGSLQTPATQTVLIKKRVLDEVGYFDERLQAAEDTELAIRVSKKYEYGFVKEPLVKVVRNHNSLMGNAQNYLYAYDILYEKHKDYLSDDILFGLSKNLASYWLQKGNLRKGKSYIKRAMKHKKNLGTVIQFILASIMPFLLNYIYKIKYKNGIPHPTQLGRVIEENQKDF